MHLENLLAGCITLAVLALSSCGLDMIFMALFRGETMVYLTLREKLAMREYLTKVIHENLYSKPERAHQAARAIENMDYGQARRNSEFFCELKREKIELKQKTVDMSPHDRLILQAEIDMLRAWQYRVRGA